jgi:uncharacterized protein
MGKRHVDNPLFEKTSLENKKWYRQFWPWVLILLPASVVIAGFCTLFIALNNPHSMVDDDYYREGLAINQSLKQDRRATELGLTAKAVFVQPDYVDVFLAGSGEKFTNFPAQLILLMFHPGSQSLDQRLQLNHLDAGHYRAQLSKTYQYSYYLRLISKDNSWRLNGKIDFQVSDTAALDSQ